MHKMLLDCALSEEGEGPPAKLVCLSGAQAIDFDSTTVTFTNGTSARFDMVLGADGVVVSHPPAVDRCVHGKTDELQSLQCERS
jgi:hypothetical protein